MRTSYGIFVSILCLTLHPQSAGLVNKLLPKQTGAVITFYIEAQPHLKPQRLDELLQTPGKLSRHYIKKNIGQIYTSGIYVTYAGFITASDRNGQVTFPRESDENELLLIVTPTIQPVMLRDNTVHHFITNPKEPIAVYKVSRLQDKNKKYYYWKTEKAHLTSNRIPWNALVLFAKPDSVIAHPGTYVTDGGQNLVLPPLSSLKFTHENTEALRLLKINHYFAPVMQTYQFTSDRYASMVKH